MRLDIKLSGFDIRTTVTTKDFGCLEDAIIWAEIETRSSLMPAITIYADGNVIAQQGYMMRGTQRYWQTLDGNEIEIN
jgi:hypothetical protein